MLSCAAIPGWITNEELHFLLVWTLNTALVNRNALEIGSYKGKTTVGMATIYRLLDSGRRVTAVDPGSNQWYGGTEQTFDILRDNISAYELDRWVSLAQCEPNLNEFHLSDQFGLVYIDGEHSLKSIRRDFWFGVDHLEDDGFILIHDDCCDTFPDVWLHCRQISERYSYRFLGTVGSMSAFQKLHTSKIAPPPII